MKTLRFCLLAAVIALVGGVLAPAAWGGLYGDEAKEITSGDLNSQDYWWTKFDVMMMDLAVKQHQPEGRIGVNLASTTKRLEDLAKKYPKHEDIQKMKKHVEEVVAKIDDNADRRTPLGPECPWEESNFAQLWVNYHWANEAYKAKDYQTAQSCLQNVMQNYDIMLKPDRMKDYPEDLRKWVETSKPDADKLYKAVKAKTQR